jgi:hypothetical protein
VSQSQPTGLDHNLAILRVFKPLSADQMQTLRNHGKQFKVVDTNSTTAR